MPKVGVVAADTAAFAAGQPLCADIHGSSLHAAVRLEARDRKQKDQLCRSVTRPALLDERVQVNAAGQVELKLKTPWRDGTTHQVLTPLVFMQRLAALVLRPLVVRQGPEVQEQATEVVVADECEVETVQARPRHISWTRLLKWVFDIDMQLCPNCGAGEPKIIAAILERPVMEKAQPHLGAGSAAATTGVGARGGARFRSLNQALNHAARHKHHAPGLLGKIAAGAATRDASARHHRSQVQPWGLDSQRPW